MNRYLALLALVPTLAFGQSNWTNLAPAGSWGIQRQELNSKLQELSLLIKPVVVNTSYADSATAALVIPTNAAAVSVVIVATATVTNTLPAPTFVGQRLDILTRASGTNAVYFTEALSKVAVVGTATAISNSACIGFIADSLTNWTMRGKSDNN